MVLRRAASATASGLEPTRHSTVMLPLSSVTTIANFVMAIWPALRTRLGRLRLGFVSTLRQGKNVVGGTKFHDGPTNVRVRKRPTSIETPPALTAGFHTRSNTSTARTSAG